MTWYFFAVAVCSDVFCGTCISVGFNLFTPSQVLSWCLQFPFFYFSKMFCVLGLVCIWQPLLCAFAAGVSLALFWFGPMESGMNTSPNVRPRYFFVVPTLHKLEEAKEIANEERSEREKSTTRRTKINSDLRARPVFLFSDAVKVGEKNNSY